MILNCTPLHHAHKVRTSKSNLEKVHHTYLADWMGSSLLLLVEVDLDVLRQKGLGNISSTSREGNK